MDISVERKTELITDGLFGYIRHPIYAFSVLLMLNVLLAAFNLIPLPPLDGSAAIDLLLPERMAGAMRSLGFAGSLIGMILAWRVFPLIARPLFDLVVGVLHPGVRYG